MEVKRCRRDEQPFLFQRCPRCTRTPSAAVVYCCKLGKLVKTCVKLFKLNNNKHQALEASSTRVIYQKGPCHRRAASRALHTALHCPGCHEMRATLLCRLWLLLTAPALVACSLSSEAALACIHAHGDLLKSSAVGPRNLTLAVARERREVVTGRVIGPLAEGANFSLACCTRCWKRRESRLQWRHNASQAATHKRHFVDDIVVATIEVTNVTTAANGLKLSCRDGRWAERSVIVLVIDEQSDEPDQSGGERANIMTLIFFGLMLALPFLVIFLRAKKGLGPM